MAFPNRSLVVCTLALLAATPAAAQQSQNSAAEQQQQQTVREIIGMPWVANGEGAVGGVASIGASKQARVLSGDSVARFIQLSGNLPDPGATIVAPPDLHWFSIYDYSDVGYVTDKDAVDANALMKSLREQQDAANSQRQQQGLAQLTIVDWAVPPHYDPASHNLEWGLKLRQSDGQELINYTARHLGRGGYARLMKGLHPDSAGLDENTSRQCALVQEAYRQAMQDRGAQI